MTIHDLAGWRARIASRVPVVDAARADQLLADVERAEHDARRAQQAANRSAAYLRQRPTRYATAAYDALHPEQDPDGKVSRWLDTGPRALLLAGPARTGKTTAAYAIANHAHAAGQWVTVWTAAGLSAALKPDGEPLAYANAVSSALLVIDDLGRERVTDWWLEQVHRIVDERCSHGRRLIVTTNAGASADAAYDELATRYGHPVVERLLDDGGVLILDGPAQRRLVTEW